MATYQIKGRVEAVGKTQTFGQRGFKKRQFVIQADEESKYPNFVQFTLTKDKTELGDSLRPGDYVTVNFVVNGRKWEDPEKGTTRYFVDLVALKVEDAGTSANTTSTPVPSVPEAPAEAAIGPSDDDSLPF